MLYYQGKGRYEKERKELWDRLVPEEGEADTIQGEMVRAISWIYREYCVNGNCNWYPGLRYRNLATFLNRQLRKGGVFDRETIRQIQSEFNDMRTMGRKWDYDFKREREGLYDRMMDRVIEWCLHHPEPIPRQAARNLRGEPTPAAAETCSAGRRRRCGRCDVCRVRRLLASFTDSM